MIRALIFAIAVAAALTAGVLVLLFNIRERKQEERAPEIALGRFDESSVDPELWAAVFPRQYDGYRRTVDTVRTRYGGSEAFSRLDENPGLRRIFAGYAFGVDYREERGHAYSLIDQKLTERTRQFQQPGACLHCHAGGMKGIFERQGGGDLMRGFAAVCAMPLAEAWALAEHPVTCVDCHDPKSMRLRVSRPGFWNGIRALKAAHGEPDYDPNRDATRQEMRSFVCGQCHVEYYFKGPEKLLVYPWFRGTRVEEIEAHYDSVDHVDWTHPETGARVLKAQHPEFELWNQGIHARSGVACADCHMPYRREGALKVTEHQIRSPLLDVSRACVTCHHFPEAEMRARAEAIQERTLGLMTRSQAALLDLMDGVRDAQARGASEVALREARALHRRAQWRFDFVAAENSLGFHAPQEAARILAEAIDYARQGQIAAQKAAPRAGNRVAVASPAVR
jgi:nitrite reductase (cytochrome c-552)